MSSGYLSFHGCPKDISFMIDVPWISLFVIGVLWISHFHNCPLDISLIDIQWISFVYRCPMDVSLTIGAPWVSLSHFRCPLHISYTKCPMDISLITRVIWISQNEGHIDVTLL